MKGGVNMGLINVPVHFDTSESAQAAYNAVSSNGYIQMSFGNEARRMVCGVSENSVIALLESNEYNISRYTAITGINMTGLKFMTFGLMFFSTLNTRAYITNYYQNQSIYAPTITNTPAPTFDSNGYSYPYSAYHARIETENTYSTTYTGIYNVSLYSNIDTAISDARNAGYGLSLTFPITYNATNCTMSGPTEASGGTEVVVNVTPASGYILRSSGVSVIDSTGVTVPHIVQGNQIAFTMPYAP